MEEYLQPSQIIDWQNPEILALADRLAATAQTTEEIAKACFEWVRDRIQHSYDYQLNPVTCRASDVLKYQTGYCFAKSHLLAALLRANQIPAGLCYQRLSLDDRGATYTLQPYPPTRLSGTGRQALRRRPSADATARPVYAAGVPIRPKHPTRPPPSAIAASSRM